MDSLEFLAIVGFFGAVLFWYLKNEEASSDGLLGMLALQDDPQDAKPGRKTSYRIKTRNAPSGDTDIRQTHKAQATSATYSIAEENARMRQRFRRQDDARYKVKDKVKGDSLSRYRSRDDNRHDD